MMRWSVAPRIGTGRAKVLTGRHGARSLVLLLVLDLCNLIGVLVVPVVPPPSVRVLLPLEQTSPELLQCTRVIVQSRVPVLARIQVVLVIVVMVQVVVVEVVLVVIMSTVEGVMKVVVVVQSSSRSELVFVHRLLQ